MAIVLGTWGYWRCDDVEHGSEALYKALQLFALAYDEDCGKNAPLLLDIARLLAAMLLAFAVIRLLFSRIWVHIKLWTQAWLLSHDRQILIGYGALNQKIARERARHGVPLTIVARSFDAAAKDFAAKYRITLVERDVRDDRALTLPNSFL